MQNLGKFRDKIEISSTQSFLWKTCTLLQSFSVHNAETCKVVGLTFVVRRICSFCGECRSRWFPLIVRLPLEPAQTPVGCQMLFAVNQRCTSLLLTVEKMQFSTRRYTCVQELAGNPINNKCTVLVCSVDSAMPASNNKFPFAILFSYFVVLTSKISGKNISNYRI